MSFKSVTLAAAVGLASMALPAWAHHSHGNYNVTVWTNLEGTVKEVHLINPHSWIYLEVKDEKGEPIVWALEATNPNGLIRAGIKRDEVKPGDTIKVRCHLMKDGSNGCLLGFVTTKDGAVKDWDGGGVAAPAAQQ
jgi:Family of unknown function (DUF6152)